MIFTIDSIPRTHLIQNDSIINQKLDGINVQMDLLDSAVIYLDSSSIESIVNNIGNEAIAITDFSVTKSDSILTQISNLRNVQTNNILNDNELLSITNIIEFNEQTINNIYLNNISKGNLNFTFQQIQLIKDIANQCPLAGGNAVFRARSIYALIDKTIHYNDFDICLLAGIAIRKKAEAQTDSPKLKVYPNPASDKITLEYESSEAANFVLKSSTGQNLFQFILKGGDSKYEFSTKALVPGVYFYSFLTSDFVDTGKIVIVR